VGEGHQGDGRAGGLERVSEAHHLAGGVDGLRGIALRHSDLLMCGYPRGAGRVQW